jgi:hypothetical protein
MYYFNNDAFDFDLARQFSLSTWTIFYLWKKKYVLLSLLAVTALFTSPAHSGEKSKTVAAQPAMAPMTATEIPPPTDSSTLKENFQGSTDGWELIGSGVKVAGGVLSCTAPDHAWWVKPHVRYFKLSFRYIHGNGIGDVVLRAADASVYDYRIRLYGKVDIVRHQSGQDSVLGTGTYNFLPGQSYMVTIQAKPGQIQVMVDGSTVVVARDSYASKAGAIGFGCVEGSGVGFDDITVTPLDFDSASPDPKKAIPINIPQPK